MSIPIKEHPCIYSRQPKPHKWCIGTCITLGMIPSPLSAGDALEVEQEEKVCSVFRKPCHVELVFFSISVYPVANGSSATSQNGLLSILGKCGTGNSDNKADQNTCCSGKTNQKYVQIHYPGGMCSNFTEIYQSQNILKITHLLSFCRH